ncbi:MAG: ubiquinol-cytochrome c reductase iron-sulfur subunit [Chromatiales bacterium]|nr:ubiquinol-cytochrome c reductase iron-sulfur subunit [Chromatiales bacterium]MDX9766916.1 ubiquinol-cytochrome c reductase iron-sulfur subunit [Ectothiorhodospiraceae bacterium]
MANEGVDKGRRRFLIGASSVVGGAGVVAAVYPFLASWQPSARAVAAGAPVEADISKIEPGQLLRVEWRGKPVWILSRTPQMLEDLPTLNSRLRDPESNVESQQPAYAKNPTRSIKPEISVLVGICTHLGCSPAFRPDVAPADLGPEWKGGYFCACHGSRFDLAGRVYQGVPAPINLLVPPHKYLSDGVLLIGVDEGAA